MFKLKRKKGSLTFANLQLVYHHPVNIHLNDRIFAAMMLDYSDKEIIVCPANITPDMEGELRVGDEVSILIPQPIGAAQGTARVKGITQSQQTFITLALRDFLHKKEERKSHRLPLSLSMEYSPGKGPESGHFTESRTVDISTGGACFFVVHSFPFSYPLNVSFDVGTGSSKTRLLLPARVVHIESKEGKVTAGVKFVDPSPYNRRLLERLITAQTMPLAEETGGPGAGRFKQKSMEIGHGRIDHDESVDVFLDWCRRRQLRPDWVILHDMHEFRGWLEIKGFSDRDIDRWLDQIIDYL